MSMNTQTAPSTVVPIAEEKTNQYLTFLLDAEEYGVDILRVQEIRGWQKATVIPNVPEYIKGVINLRGVIVPIVDLRQRFGMETPEYGATTVTIVLKVKVGDAERTMGIVVDAVSDVYDIGADRSKPPPDFGAVVEAEFVKGLATVNEKLVILLDIDRLVGVGAFVDAEQPVH